MLPSASALASRREERVQKAFSVDHHGPGDARLSHRATAIYGEHSDYVTGRLLPSSATHARRITSPSSPDPTKSMIGGSLRSSNHVWRRRGGVGDPQLPLDATEPRIGLPVSRRRSATTTGACAPARSRSSAPCCLRCEQARSRGASPPAPGADLPGTPDPRGAIAIWVL